MLDDPCFAIMISYNRHIVIDEEINTSASNLEYLCFSVERCSIKRKVIIVLRLAVL